MNDLEFHCFQVLGISPTKDIREIKTAYSKLLKLYHPEEFPEKFKEIHEAYEKAISYANDVSTSNNISYPIYKNTKLDEKFSKLDEHETAYYESEIEIPILFEIMKNEKEKNSRLPTSFFESELFVKYRYNKDFLKQYIELIDNGFYFNLCKADRLEIKKIHEEIYFNQNKELYEDLYNALKPYYSFRRACAVEKALLYAAMIASVFVCSSTPYGRTAWVFENIIYFAYIFYVPLHQNPKYKNIRAIFQIFTWLFIIIFYFIGLGYTYNWKWRRLLRIILKF